MGLRLGQDGYAFAQIRAVPELDKETKEAAITFFVDPKNRVYVRRINFNGADSVNDEVFRREMRQMEGGFLSNSLVDRRRCCCSGCRTSRRSSTRRRPWRAAADLVDVDFAIEEGLPGQFGGSLGFSETYGVTLGGNFVHSNFMGTGNRVRSICAAASSRRCTTSATPTRIARSTACRASCRSRIRTSRSSRRSRRTSRRPRCRRASTGAI